MDVTMSVRVADFGERADGNLKIWWVVKTMRESQISPDKKRRIIREWEIWWYIAVVGCAEYNFAPRLLIHVYCILQIIFAYYCSLPPPVFTNYAPKYMFKSCRMCVSEKILCYACLISRCFHPSTLITNPTSWQYLFNSIHASNIYPRTGPGADTSWICTYLQSHFQLSAFNNVTDFINIMFLIFNFISFIKLHNTKKIKEYNWYPVLSPLE